MSLFKAETIIEVPFYDVDFMDIVWHGNYLKYLEVARCDLLDKLGYNYMDMRQDGLAYPLAKMDVKYIKSACFGQKLKVITSVEEIEPSLNMKYLIVDAETGEKIFSAKSMQICIDAKSRESRYCAPERLLGKIRNLKND